jgi:hypothetical protein
VLITWSGYWPSADTPLEEFKFGGPAMHFLLRYPQATINKMTQQKKRKSGRYSHGSY